MRYFMWGSDRVFGYDGTSWWVWMSNGVTRQYTALRPPNAHEEAAEISEKKAKAQIVAWRLQ